MILFEDRWLIAVNKPAGVLSHPNTETPSVPPRRDCAFEGRYHFQERRFDAPGGSLWLVHRLDQDTSGVLLATKSAEMAKKCRACFEETSPSRIRKIYLALVAGKPSPVSGVWRDHLEKRIGHGKVRSSVLRNRPPNAELRYAVRHARAVADRERRQGDRSSRARKRIGTPTEEEKSVSLLEIILLTGRTHQIRVQAATHRHPVAGDRIYGDFSLNRRLRHEIGLRRLFLHAWRLDFRHPMTGHFLSLEAPVPLELEKCLARLPP